MVWQVLKARLLVQGPLEPVFAKALYDFSQDKILFNESMSAILARAQTLKPTSGVTEYWQEIGLALTVHADQFGGNVASIQSALNTAAGFAVPIFQNWLKGQTGNEYFEGSKFADYIDLLAGNDRVVAGAGNDSILGGAGNDTIAADSDNDTIIGGLGNDSVQGDRGNDLYRYAKGDGNDTVYESGGSADVDQLIITGYTTANTVFTRVGNTTDLQISFTGTTTDKILVRDGLEVGTDTMETITIGGVNRTIASIRTEVLTKQTTAGNDTIDGFYGTANTLSGGLGNDSVSGDNYNDQLKGDDGNDLLYGDSGNDVIYGGNGLDKLYGERDNDKLYGDAGNDTIDAGYGVDTLAGGAGADIFEFGNAGSDLGVGAAADRISDFSRSSGDKISISAFAFTAANFIGNLASKSFTSGGIKEFGYQKLSDAGGNYTLVRFDDDNNGVSDREIRLDGIHLDMLATDFLY